MESLYLKMVGQLLLALLAGALIGMERSYHGRPAGFRTHALVCAASALLMMVTLYESFWFHGSGVEHINLDPTRMAQGIMTGIGFLGAGVIMKEGHSVRGLTTAASIWITSVIGILMGAGMYFLGAFSTAMVLGVLAAFRWIEMKMPMEFFAYHTLRVPRTSIIPEEEIRKLMAAHGFTVANMGFRLDNARNLFEYTMVIKTKDRSKVQTLVRVLEQNPGIVEFELTPSGD